MDNNSAHLPAECDPQHVGIDQNRKVLAVEDTERMTADVHR
jgi:hypothetical protein